MATKLKLYKEACRLIKQTPITALTDDVNIRYELDDVYDETLLYMLSEGYWDFAMRTVAIESSSSVSPNFGYSYVFPKPDDWVRTGAISSVATMWPELGPEGFVDETVYWNANCDPLYVSYVSSDTSWGLDLSLWSPTFTCAVGYELAFRIAPSIANLAGAEMEALEKRKYRYLRDARSKDAQNDASRRPPPGRLTMSRSGRMVRGWSGTTR